MKDTIINKLPELSIVIPCYNEEAVLKISITPLLELLKESHIEHEIILVNNGSKDKTADIIDSFTTGGYPVRRVDVPVNIGYGWGIICGLKVVRGKYTGYMSADGQVRPEDVLRIFRVMQNSSIGTVLTAVRINRADGWQRVLVSKFYNLLLHLLFGNIGKDANGTPRFFYKENLDLLKPVSKCSFIDPEILIKAKYLKYKIVQIPVTFYDRQGGSSSVRVISKSLEFLKDMFAFRFGTEYKLWRSAVKNGSQTK